MQSTLPPLIQRDLNHVWHPGSQMKDFEQCPPFEVLSAQGSYLYTPQGKVIDAIASWWCKPLGHRHPAIVAAIQQQLDHFEHVIGAHATYKNLVLLTEKLAALTGLPYSLFASDGSCAVEMAMKLTIHARMIQGQPQKTTFLSLKNSYHGETLGSLSVSDLGVFKSPYQSHCFPCHHIEIPYTTGLEDRLSQDASVAWAQTLPQLEAIKSSLNALVFEPVIQGSHGMRTYSVDFLNRLMQWAKINGIYCIADEIMTGLCRTGRWLATEYTTGTPDLICLSKGLTAGALPLSMTLVSQSLFDLFYDDHNFIHSHTHSTNALAVSAALAALQTLESESINEQACALQGQLHQAFEWLNTHTGVLSHIRGIGGIIAADLAPSSTPRLSLRLHQEALKRGALLRPIGDTLYWFPPLNLTESTLGELTQITYESLQAVYPHLS